MTSALSNPLVTATAFKQNSNDTIGLVLCEDERDGSLVVSEIAPDSPLADALPAGSKIVAINHVQPLTAEHAMQLILEQPEEEEVNIVALKPTIQPSVEDEVQAQQSGNAGEGVRKGKHKIGHVLLDPSLQQYAVSSLSAFLPLLENHWPRRPLRENQPKKESTPPKEITVTSTIQHRVGLELRQVSVKKNDKRSSNFHGHHDGEMMVIIDAIDEKSPFLETELQEGMELISINGWEVKGQVFEHVVRFLQGTPKETPVTIVARKTTAAAAASRTSASTKQRKSKIDTVSDNTVTEGKVDHDDLYDDNENGHMDEQRTNTEIPRVIVTHYPVNEGKEEDHEHKDSSDNKKKKESSVTTKPKSKNDRVIAVCKLVENPQLDGAGVFFRTEQSLLRIGAISTVSPFYGSALEPGQVVLAINGMNVMEWSPYNTLQFLRTCPEGLITIQTYRLKEGEDGIVVDQGKCYDFGDDVEETAQENDSQGIQEEEDDEEEERGDIAALAQVNLCTLFFGVPNNKNVLHNAIELSDSPP